MNQPVVDVVAPAEEGPGRRRRAWLRALCALLVVAIYVNIWTTYALHGLTQYGRYVQQAPGVTVTAMGAEFRLQSLTQTTMLINSISEEVERPPVGAVWLVARIDVVRHSQDQELFCSFETLGPQRRIWGPSSSYVSRDAEGTCDADTMVLGRTYPLEVIFTIPERYVGDLAGIVVSDPASRGARPVLVPPAG